MANSMQGFRPSSAIALGFLCYVRRVGVGPAWGINDTREAKADAGEGRGAKSRWGGRDM